MIKIPEEILLDLKVDEATIMKQLLDIEQKTLEVDQMIEATGQKSEETWLMAVGVAQASWTLIDSITSAMGLTLSHTMRAVIQGAFTTINVLTAIATATALTPGMQIAAGFSFAAIALAISSAVAADIAASQIETDIRSGSAILNDIGNILGALEG